MQCWCNNDHHLSDFSEKMRSNIVIGGKLYPIEVRKCTIVQLDITVGI